MFAASCVDGCLDQQQILLSFKMVERELAAMPFSRQISALVLSPFSTASINFNFGSKERHFCFVDAITDYGISMIHKNAKYCM